VLTIPPLAKIEPISGLLWDIPPLLDIGGSSIVTCSEREPRQLNQQVITMKTAQTVEDFLTEVGDNEDSKEQLVLSFDEVHSLDIETVAYGEGEYGEYVALTTDSNIIFFSSYEMNAVKKVIGEAEAPFSLKILRQKKASTKSDRTYNKVTAQLLEVVG